MSTYQYVLVGMALGLAIGLVAYWRGRQRAAYQRLDVDSKERRQMAIRDRW